MNIARRTLFALAAAAPLILVAQAGFAHQDGAHAAKQDTASRGASEAMRPAEQAPTPAEPWVILDVAGEPLLVLDADPASHWIGTEQRIVDLDFRDPVSRFATVAEGALPERILTLRDTGVTLMIEDIPLCTVELTDFAIVDRFWGEAEEGEAWGEINPTLVGTLSGVDDDCYGATWALPVEHASAVTSADYVDDLDIEEAIARQLEGHIDYHPDMDLEITLLQPPDSGQLLAWTRGQLIDEEGGEDLCGIGLWAELGVLHNVEYTRDGIELTTLHEGFAYDLVDYFDADGDGGLELLFDYDPLESGVPSTALIRSSNDYAEPAWSKVASLNGCGC